MSDSFPISRRIFAGGALLLASGSTRALSQGFAGLGMDGSGFASVSPGRIFSFPADLGPHPDYRIEWWYVTANLDGFRRGRLWRAVDPVSSGIKARRAAGRLGQSANLDGPRRGDPRGPSQIYRNLRPRRRRPGRCGGQAVSGLDRFMANARSGPDGRYDDRTA